jgi:hypothetical protein
MIVKPQCIFLVFSFAVGCAVSGQFGSSKGLGSLSTSRTNSGRSVSEGPLPIDSRLNGSALIDVPPTVVVRCPDKSPVEGDRTIFYADSTKLPRASYRWKVSQGRITKGQGTKTITVDTNGAGGKKLRASVEMNDGNNHLMMTSCEIDVKLRNSQ